MRYGQRNQLLFSNGLIHLSSYGLIHHNWRNVELIDSFLDRMRRLHMNLAVLRTLMLNQGLGLDHVQYHKLAVVRMVGE